MTILSFTHYYLQILLIINHSMIIIEIVRVRVRLGLGLLASVLLHVLIKIYTVSKK